MNAVSFKQAAIMGNTMVCMQDETAQLPVLKIDNLFTVGGGAAQEHARRANMM